MFGDDENEDDEDDKNSLDDQLIEGTPMKAALESEMDLVSARSNSLIEKEALQDNYNKSVTNSPFKVNSTYFLK